MVLIAFEPVLRAAGWALVVEEPISPADIIVIATHSFGAGALQAADLVRSGIATQVALFTDPPSGEDLEFIRRGLPYEDEAATPSSSRTAPERWLAGSGVSSSLSANSKT